MSPSEGSVPWIDAYLQLPPHWPIQSCLSGQGYPLDFALIVTRELRGFTKRCFPRAMLILNFQASVLSLCFASESIAATSQVIHTLDPHILSES